MNFVHSVNFVIVAFSNKIHRPIKLLFRTRGVNSNLCKFHFISFNQESESRFSQRTAMQLKSLTAYLFAIFKS